MITGAVHDLKRIQKRLRDRHAAVALFESPEGDRRSLEIGVACGQLERLGDPAASVG